jgi:hypothetical protein
MSSKYVLIALLLVAGCDSATRDPAGAGGTGGSGGAGGSGNPSSCSGTLNGSCRNNNDIECREVTGLPATALSAVEAACEEDDIGTWTPGSACDHTGAPGGCRRVNDTVCDVLWRFEATAAESMSQCADDGGTWIAP